jgi:hypothetical protein
MVSDIVLLKELQEIIKKNAQAYIGCVAGAEMKNKYLRIIEDAGFQEVKVIEESLFPSEYAISDPTAQKIIKDSKMPAKKIKEMTSTIASIKVFALKPNAQQH